MYHGSRTRGGGDWGGGVGGTAAKRNRDEHGDLGGRRRRSLAGV